MKANPRKKRNDLEIPNDLICRALSKSRGHKTLAAKALDKSAAWMAERCKIPEIAEHLKKVEEERLDEYEDALDKLMVDGNTTAVIFYLKTKGRHRGYVEHAPTAEINLQHFSALKEFFSSIPSKPQEIAQAQPPSQTTGGSDRQQSQEPQSTSQYAESSSAELLGATENGQVSLGLQRGKIVRLETNFP